MKKVIVTGGSGLTAIAGVTTGSGNVTITDGNLILDAGNGIDFSDATDTATGETTTGSLLDDYEEGTWTPQITSNSLETDQTYGLGEQIGFYTKVGRIVTLGFYVAISNKGTMGGTYLVIAGLPFTTASVYNAAASMTITYWSGFANAMGTVTGGYGAGVSFYVNGMHEGTTQVTGEWVYPADINDNATFRGTMTYQGL